MKSIKLVSAILILSVFSANAFSSSKSIDDLENECKKKNGTSCRSLGSKYIFSRNKDHRKAIKYYKQACSLNDVTACRMLWIWHKQGKFHKIRLSKSMAGRYRQKAEKAAMHPGDRATAEASIQLGFDYYLGSMKLKKSKKKAYKYFKYGIDYLQSQCNKGDKNSCRRVESLLTSSSISEFRDKLVSKKTARDKAVSGNSAEETGGTPTKDQAVFIKFLQDYERYTQNNNNKTSVQRNSGKRKFDTKYRRKRITFRKLYLLDVDDGGASYISGPNHCHYEATFIIPEKEGSTRTSNLSTGYRSPKIVLKGICRKEALKYKKGKLYRVRGRMTSYYIFPPQKRVTNYKKKYFHAGSAVLQLKK